MKSCEMVNSDMRWEKTRQNQPSVLDLEKFFVMKDDYEG